MANEWCDVALSDIIDLISGGTPKRSAPKYWNGDIPWLSVKDFNHDLRYVDTSEQSITGLGLAKSSTTLLPKGYLIISARGTVGAISQLSRPMAFNQSCYGISAKSKYMTNDFLYYLIRCSIDKFKRMTHGAVFDTITRETFQHINVKLPPLPEQRAIAHILGTLDDKIELNRRMNETLEEMTQALFKSWFVNFDPVRAKMEGLWFQGQSLPGLPANLWDFFPDKFIDSKLGQIPDGWNISDFGTLAKITSGKRPSARFSETSQEANVALWGGNGPMGFVPKPLFQEPILLTGRVGTLGSVFRITSHSWPSDNTLVLIPKNSAYFEFLYFQLHQINFSSLNRGSTQPLLAQADIKIQQFCLPRPNVLQYFHMIVSDIFKRVDTLQNETASLSDMRDTLLPRLVSGEIRLREAEKAVEVVT